MALTRSVLAPGKLFVLGEYAVLDGAPALVAAVDRGVRCEVHSGPFGIESPHGDRFVRPALDYAQAPPARYVFSDWNPPGLPGKGGFGGSAAATVAACAAAGLTGDELEAVALRSHRAVQGSGSGMDVRASVRGGLRRYEAGASGPPLPKPPLVAVWSGHSSFTGPRVQRYRDWDDRDGFLRRSRELVELFEADPVHALDQAWRLLCVMGTLSGVAYATPGLARIVALAREHGGAAKASGAGGGDVAVALIPDPEARRNFEQACALEGLTPVPIQIVDGVEVREHESG
jgi:phosphomevalonate kinase